MRLAAVGVTTLAFRSAPCSAIHIFASALIRNDPSTQVYRVPGEKQDLERSNHLIPQSSARHVGRVQLWGAGNQSSHRYEGNG